MARLPLVLTAWMKSTKENEIRISQESLTQQSGMKKDKGAKSRGAEEFSNINGAGDC